jgi:hypothetical protein
MQRGALTLNSYSAVSIGIYFPSSRSSMANTRWDRLIEFPAGIDFQSWIVERILEGLDV